MQQFVEQCVRRAAKRDGGERSIVGALESVGAVVQRLNEKGAPDLLVGWNAKTFLLECKSENGKLTPDQVLWLAKWRGAAPVVVRDAFDALRAIGALESNA